MIEQDEMYDERNFDTKTILLCTIVRKSDLFRRISLIKKAFKIDRNRIFVLNDDNVDPTRFILTYNIVVPVEEQNQPHYDSISNTFRINRNKEYNSLYTVSALNEVIKEEYGEYQKNAVVDWSKYPNCLLITDRTNELVNVQTSINSIQII